MINETAILRLVLAAFPILLAAGCPIPPANGTGSRCGITWPPGTAVESSWTTVASPALECDGRVCIQVGGRPPLCSVACSSDDDCLDVAPSAGDNCRRGFTCAAGAGVGQHACQRLCTCKDGFQPATACPPS